MRTLQVSPEPAEFYRRFDDYRQAIAFLHKAQASRSSANGEFEFPHGRMRVEGFNADQLQRIGDWFRILELGREVGYTNPPKAALEAKSFTSPVLPFLFLIVSAIPVLVVTVLSLVGLLPDKGGIWIGGVVILALLLAGVVLSGRRLRWYFRVRARVAETGERMPHGLGLVN